MLEYARCQSTKNLRSKDYLKYGKRNEISSKYTNVYKSSYVIHADPVLIRS